MSDCKLETKTFFQAIENEALIGSRCLNCGHISLPQRYICSRCHSNQAERLEFAGTGKLPVVHIEDWPDFPNRGVMLDIARDLSLIHISEPTRPY